MPTEYHSYIFSGVRTPSLLDLRPWSGRNYRPAEPAMRGEGRRVKWCHLLKYTNDKSQKRNKNGKSAQRDANTARALAVVRFGHRPPARHKQTNTQTGPITIHCAAG